MYKVTKYFEKFEFDEQCNKVYHNMVEEEFYVPCWGVVWRWLLWGFITIALIVGIALLGAFVDAQFYCAYLLFIVYFSTICFVIIGVEQYCDNMVEDEYQQTREKYQQYNYTILQQRDKWREEHQLEEYCRKALEKNPNEVANLIKYIKNYIDIHTRFNEED